MKSTNKRLDELARAMAGLGRGDAGGRAQSADTIIEGTRAVLAEAERNPANALAVKRATELERIFAKARRRRAAALARGEGGSDDD